MGGNCHRQPAGQGIFRLGSVRISKLGSRGYGQPTTWESSLHLQIIHLAMVQQNASLAEPPGASVLVAAVNWLLGTLFGTIAIVLATISVGMVGILMLSGRVNLRRGVSVILGCFILFGASSIAAGLRGMARGDGYSTARRTPLTGPVPPRPVEQATPESGYDPYAGASVPTADVQD